MSHNLKRGRGKKVARNSAVFALLLSNLIFNYGLIGLPAQTPPQTAKTRPAKAAPPAPGSVNDVPAPNQLAGWSLKFDEEFDGQALNYSKWSPHPPSNVIPAGIQTWTPEAIAISSGQAHLTARKQSTGFTSGILTTFGTFAQTYGRFEIRFRVPAGRGLEPLFRLLPIPAGETPSIDVMNTTGGDPANAVFTNRWADARSEREYTGSYRAADLSVGFHIISIEWDEEKIVWTVDGVERFQSYEGVPHQPLYLTLMLVVGTDKAGEPNPQTKFPATLDIDYVRVFARP